MRVYASSVKDVGWSEYSSWYNYVFHHITSLETPEHGIFSAFLSAKVLREELPLDWKILMWSAAQVSKFPHCALRTLDVAARAATTPDEATETKNKIRELRDKYVLSDADIRFTQELAANLIVSAKCNKHTPPKKFKHFSPSSSKARGSVTIFKYEIDPVLLRHCIDLLYESRELPALIAQAVGFLGTYYTFTDDKDEIYDYQKSVVSHLVRVKHNEDAFAALNRGKPLNNIPLINPDGDEESISESDAELNEYHFVDLADKLYQTWDSAFAARTRIDWFSRLPNYELVTGPINVFLVLAILFSTLAIYAAKHAGTDSLMRTGRQLVACFGSLAVLDLPDVSGLLSTAHVLLALIGILAAYLWRHVIVINAYQLIPKVYLPPAQLDTDDPRPVDMTLAGIDYAAGYYICEVSHLRLYAFGNSYGLRPVWVKTIKLNVNRFMHLTSARHLSDDDQVTQLRLLAALRSQTPHNTSRSDTTGGSEPVAYKLAVSWYGAIRQAGDAALNCAMLFIHHYLTQDKSLAGFTLTPVYRFTSMFITIFTTVLEEVILQHPNHWVAYPFLLFVICVESFFIHLMCLKSKTDPTISICMQVAKHLAIRLVGGRGALKLHLAHNAFMWLRDDCFSAVFATQDPKFVTAGMIFSAAANFLALAPLIILPSNFIFHLFVGKIYVTDLNLIRKVPALYGFLTTDVPHKRLPKVRLRYNIKYHRHRPGQRPVAVKIGPTPSLYASPRPCLSEPFGPVEALHHRMSIQGGDLTPAQLNSISNTSYWLIQSYIKQGLIQPLNANSRCSLEEWLVGTSYPEARRDQLRAAYDRVLEGFLHFAKSGKVKCFIKDEPYGQLKPFRGIYARGDKGKVLMAMLFHLIEHEVFKLKAFIKTVPMDQRADFMRNRFGVHADKYTQLLETDFSKMESHFTAKMKHALEWPLYDTMCRGAPQFHTLLRQIHAKLCGWSLLSFRNGEVTTKVKARRLSGEMNTSLGNGWATLVLMHHMVFLLYGKRIHLVGVFEGDDGLIKIDLKKIGGVPSEAWFFANLGFRIKLEVRQNVDESLFCGTMQAEGSSHTLYDPKKFLRNIGWSASRHVNFGKSKRDMLIRVKTLSYRHMFPTCPVIARVCDRILELTADSKPSERFIRTHLANWQYEKYKLNVRGKYFVGPTTAAERLLVEKQFGMPIEEQLRLEHNCKSWTLDTWFEPSYDDHPDTTSYLEKYLGTTTMPPHDTDWVWPEKFESTSIGPPLLYLNSVQPELNVFRMLAVICYGLVESSLELRSPHHCQLHKSVTPAPIKPMNVKNTKQNTPRNPQATGKSGKTPKGRNPPVDSRGNVRRNTDRVSEADRHRRLRGVLELTRRINESRTVGLRRGGRNLPPGSRLNNRQRGPSAPRSHPRPARAAVVDQFAVAAGTKGPTIAKFRIHSDASTFLKALKKRFGKVKHNEERSSFTHEDAPVAMGTSMEFHGGDEHESIKKDGRHLRVTGRALLDTVHYPGSVAAAGGIANIPTQLPVGSRLGVFVLSPDWIGGRLALAAKDFQTHKFHNIRVYYVPNVPTTTGGAFMIYCTNDVGIDCMVTGSSELAHACTTEKSEQFPVWTAAAIDFKPNDMLKTYADNASEERFESQGLVIIETASDVDFASFASMGTLYMDYDCEFHTPTLSYQIPARSDAQITLTFAAIMGDMFDYRPLVGITGLSPHVPILKMFGVGVTWPQGVAPREAQMYVLQFQLHSPIESDGTIQFISTYDPLLESQVGLGVGQTLFARFWPITSGSNAVDDNTYCVLYPSLEQAANDISIQTTDDANESAVQWVGQTFVGKAQSTIYASGFWHQLD
jgi:hypothetical protein